MKTCIRCKQDKSLNDFHKESRRRDGLCNHCKECEYIRSKIKKEKDPDGFRKYKRENAKKHSEKRKETWKKNYPNIKEKYLEKRRDEYQRDKEKISDRRKIIHNTDEFRFKANERSKKWSKENREKVRVIQKKYINKNKDKILELHNNWRKENKEKSLAQARVRDHIRRGTMIRPSNCETCMKECKPHGHHEDYSRPLEVKWLCKVCHMHVHGKLLDVDS